MKPPKLPKVIKWSVVKVKTISSFFWILALKKKISNTWAFFEQNKQDSFDKGQKH